MWLIMFLKQEFKIQISPAHSSGKFDGLVGQDGSILNQSHSANRNYLQVEGQNIGQGSSRHNRFGVDVNDSIKKIKY